MWAVVDINTKQYRVKEGDTIDVDFLGANKDGMEHFLDKVLLFSNEKEVLVGQPYVQSVKVRATLEKTFKDEKIIVFTYKRRKGYMKKSGHRQTLSRLKILKIEHKA